MSDLPETRVVSDTWDLSTYTWRTQTDGLKLLIDGLKDKKILGRKCGQCGTVYVPGQLFCRKCFIEIPADSIVEVSHTGQLVTYTVNLADVRGNPVDEITIPSVVKLDGAVSWFMGELKNIDWKQVKVGMRVKLRFKPTTSGALADMDGFEPA